MTRENERTAGLVVFIAICMLASWTVAATNRALQLDATQQRLGTQLLTISVHYLATMGWQPVVAAWIVRRWVDRDPVDLAIRPPQPRFSAFAVVAALVFAVAAALLAHAGMRFGLFAATSVNGSVEAAASVPRSLGQGLALTLGAVVALVLIWLQAVGEEIGWRGYVLPTAMRRFGHWRGLLVHALMWAVWYAPVVFFAAHAGASGIESLVRCATFSVTCVLLGVLLGWLRLASNSVAPAVTANLTLTVVAGLPYVIHGLDAGIRSAIVRPIGWLVLAAAVGVLLHSRWRRAVTLPGETHAGTPAIGVAHVVVVFGGRRDRTLH